MKTLYLFVPLILSLASFYVEGSCFPESVKRRVLIVWNGIADQNLFNHEVEDLFRFVGASAQLKFALLGPNAATPSINTSGLQTFKASAKNLKEVIKKINVDYNQFIQQGGKPGSYEVIFQITNHGGMARSGKRIRYFIPANEDGEGDISESDMKAFGRGLPEGIRFKSIFSQCFSSNHLEKIMNAISNKSCACGVSSADFTMPAQGVTGRGDVNFIVSRMSKGTSLSKSAMQRYFDYGGFSKNVGLWVQADALNSYSTSSDIYAFKKSGLKYDRIFDAEIAIQTDQLATEPNLSQFSETQKLRKEVIREYLGNDDSYLKSVIKNDDEADKISEQDSKLRSKLLELIKQMYSLNSTQEQICKIKEEVSQIKNKINGPQPLQLPSTSAMRLTARGKIESVFLSKATPNEIKRYQNIKNCELESLQLEGF